MHIVAGEARSLETRLARTPWLVGEDFSAADVVVFPGIQMLLRALDRREAHDLRGRLLPLENNIRPSLPGSGASRRCPAMNDLSAALART